MGDDRRRQPRSRHGRRPRSNRRARVIRVAILGAGFMGRSHAANYAALHGRAHVKTVAARREEQAEQVAETVGATATTDLEAAIADPELDAVDICLPTPLHRLWAERALAWGKHVFLEKPIALTAEDADAIIDAADASRRVFMVGLVLRFWPEYVEFQRRIAAGELGARSRSRPTACRRRSTGTTGWPTRSSRAAWPSTCSSTISTR